MKKRINQSNITTYLYLIVFTCFTKIFAEKVRFNDIGIDIYGYLVISVAFMYCVSSCKSITKGEIKLLAIVIFFFIFQILNKLLLGFDLGPLLKQVIPIILYYSVFYILVSRYKITTLFCIYMNLSVFCAYFGLLQFLLHLLGVDILVDYPGRLNSFLPEASHYAAVTIPAFVYSFFYLGRHKKTFIIGIALFLTFSASAYMALFIVFICHYIKRAYYVVIAIPIITILIVAAYFKIDIFSEKVNDLFLFFQTNNYYLINATSFSFFSNLLPAIESLKNYPILGVGLGGHSEWYEYYYSYIDIGLKSHRLYSLNQVSAHSLIIRMISELGIMLVVFMYGLFWCYQRISSLFIRDYQLYCIGLAALSACSIRFFKFGGYFDYGLPFFVCIFVYLSIRGEEILFKEALK